MVPTDQQHRRCLGVSSCLTSPRFETSKVTNKEMPTGKVQQQEILNPTLLLSQRIRIWDHLARENYSTKHQRNAVAHFDLCQLVDPHQTLTRKITKQVSQKLGKESGVLPKLTGNEATSLTLHCHLRWKLHVYLTIIRAITKL